MREQNRHTILPLSLENISFAAGGKTLIKSISFTVTAGPRTAILGPNGAGKSLLLRICHGLVRPSGGRVDWQGARRAEDTVLRQAMVFQRPVMLRRTAAENVDYALRVRGVPKRERKRLVTEALKVTRLHRHARHQARVLSVGEQQRLALARAWALRPDVLFLDEPTASLDPAVTRTIEDLITAIDESGSKIIMTTHDLGQARRLADEVIFLHRGRLLEHTPADEFFDRPRSEAARAFVAGELFW